MKKGPNGYGFNLHSDKSRPGQFIRAVDPDSPAEASGLREQDRIVEVNGVCVEGKQHGDVVTAIKAGGDETKLLVVDKETDEFFKKCKVVPSSEHLNGPLPEPFTNGEIQKNNPETLAPAASESPRPALARSASSDTSEELASQDSPKKEDSTAPSSTSSSSDPILDFSISLAVAKERAHQKRSSRRAPKWTGARKRSFSATSERPGRPPPSPPLRPILQSPAAHPPSPPLRPLLQSLAAHPTSPPLRPLLQSPAAHPTSPPLRPASPITLESIYRSAPVPRSWPCDFFRELCTSLPRGRQMLFCPTPSNSSRLCPSAPAWLCLGRHRDLL